MIKTIVVPVDHTEETKTALNIAAWLSLLLKAKLLLLGISHDPPLKAKEVHPPHGDITLSENPSLFRDQYNILMTYPVNFTNVPELPFEEVTFNSEEEQDLESYIAYLQKELTRSLLPNKIPAEQISQRIESGSLVHALKDLAAQEHIDLVVLPAHQESLLRQLLFSSQSNRVLRRDQLPVVVVPRGFKLASLNLFEKEVSPVDLDLYIKPVNKGHLMVTLDGTAQAEAALPLVTELAIKLNMSLYLLMVLPLDSHKTYLDPETDEPIKLEAVHSTQYDFASRYLYHIQQGFTDRGISSHRIILEGKADERIDQFMGRAKPILTILATHAYPKVEEILLGSVAEKVIKASSLLVLLVPFSYALHSEEPPVTNKAVEGEEAAKAGVE